MWILITLWALGALICAFAIGLLCSLFIDEHNKLQDEVNKARNKYNKL